MILVTGAAGKTGLAIIRALACRGQPVRALVHRAQQESQAMEAGARNAQSGDMRLPATMERAMAGARAVYHICPNMSPDEVTIGQAAIAAAFNAGVEHLVYHSVLHPQTEAMPHHWQKLRVEERLFESGLAYTILQPAAYYQNVLSYWDQIVETGLYAVPYPAKTRLSMVDLGDVAAAAATVLIEPGHSGATYELAGSEALSPTDIATILGRLLGRPVQAEAVPLADWRRGARAAGLGDYQVDTLLKMFHYYERFGFRGNPSVLGWLLGRPPTTFASFVARMM